MKSKIFKIVLGLILFSALFITVSSAATTVKENVQNYDDIIYIIGSTRFDSNIIITAQRAANAGVNEAKRLVAMGKSNQIENLDLRTYCYNPYFDEWYEIQEEAKTLTEEEVKEVEENLNIFFVNNEEKILEFTHEANEENVNVLTDGVTFDGKKFSVPATKTEFKFIENNVEAVVETKTDKTSSTDEKLDYGNFEIKYNPVVSFEMPEEFIVGKAAEFTVSTTANSYQGTMIVGTGGISAPEAIEKLEYYEVKNNQWYEMPKDGQFGVATGFPLSDATSKFRVTFSTEGEYGITFAIKNVETSAIMASANATANVKSENTIAKVGQKYYESLTEAIKNATDSTVTLIQDTEITQNLEIDNNVTLDLGKNKINITGSECARIVAAGTANVTIKNGNILSSSNYCLYVKDNATLNVAKDLNIEVKGVDYTNNNNEQYAIVVNRCENPTLNFEGNLVVESSGHFACGISGNGSNKEQYTTVNILGGSIKVADGIAVYQPQRGEVNIEAGILEANTTIGVKSGKITISGGTLKATGAKAEAIAMGNNTSLTGDVIYIEQNTAYYGDVSVNITGGKLTATNGYIMKEYNPTIGTEKERKTVVTGNYETRTMLENNVTIFTETSKAAFETANGTKYVAGNLEVVMQNPSLNGETVTLLKDIDAPSTMELKAKVTLELNNCNLTIKEDTEGWGVFRVLEGGDLTINGDGIVDGTGKNDYNMVLCAEAGNITINGGTYTNTSIIGDDDHYDVIYAHKTGQIVINGGHFEGKTPAWLLNIYDKDRETAKIEVKGGEFVGFDPANNKAEGEGTNFVADRYMSVEKDGVYTVVPIE